MQPATRTTSARARLDRNAPEEVSRASHQSDLLRHCFAKSESASDEIRSLAFANSICLMFVVIAFIGIKSPIFVVGGHDPEEPIVPVIFEAPPAVQQTLAKPQVNPELLDPSEEPLEAAPEIVPVLVADSAEAAFAVPVEGPTILTPAKLAAPPPRIAPRPQPVNSGPPRAVEFSSGTQNGGFYPEPDYPRSALQRRMEGRVMLYVIVGESGAPRSIEVRDSSGWPLLDRHALDFVKRRWHWPAGNERHYLVPFRFQINKS